MLILSRRLGEKIRIGDEVSLTILGIKGKQVRIGIDAPREVAVHREEVYLQIVEESNNTDNAEQAKDTACDDDSSSVSESESESESESDALSDSQSPAKAA